MTDLTKFKSWIFFNPRTTDSYIFIRNAFFFSSDEVKSESDRDEAMKYWQSEHHRFESSEISRALCDADPLSYHQMALAIPGSFLSRCESLIMTVNWTNTFQVLHIKVLQIIEYSKHSPDN